MSNQQPPSELLPVFNTTNFPSTLTNTYVTYPVAQGLETFPNGIKFGDGTVMTTADISGLDISGVANPMDSNLDANDFDIFNVDDLEVSTITLNTQSGALTQLAIGSQTSFGGNKIVDIATPVAGTDGANKTYVDSTATGQAQAWSSYPAVQDVSMGGFKIEGMAEPVASTDATTKNYVDSNFLLSTTASATYETIATAAATYETIATAAATYETITNAATTYETIANAAATYAPKNNAALTGNPTAPTQAASDNSTSIATTAFVHSQGSDPIQTNYFQGVGTIMPYIANVPPGWLDTNSFQYTQNPSTFNPSNAWLLTYTATGINAYAVDKNLGFTVYKGATQGVNANSGNNARLWGSIPMSGITTNTGIGKVGVSNNEQYIMTQSSQAPQLPDTLPFYYISQDYGQNVTKITSTTGMKWTGGPMMSGPGKIQGATFSNDNTSNLTYKVSYDYGTTWTEPDFGLGAGVMATNSVTVTGVSNTAPSCMSKNGQIWYKFYNFTDASGNAGRFVGVRSTDGGKSFQQIGPWPASITTNQAPQCCCCSAAGDTFYVAMRINGAFTGNLTYFSYDYGETLNACRLYTGSFLQGGPDQWIDCDATGQLVVSIVANDDGVTNTKGLYVSRNGANYFDQVGGTSRNGITCSISGNGQVVSYGPFQSGDVEAQFYA